MIDKNGYRLNVGIIITNPQGKLFWGKRVGNANAWQFPQGGVNPYETLKETMFRELNEETGLSKQDVEIISITQRWISYTLPENMRRHFQNPLCIGQRQKWFLLRLVSGDEKICLTSGATPEFDHWCWVDYWHPVKQVIFFKRKSYQKVLKEFEHLVQSYADLPTHK